MSTARRAEATVRRRVRRELESRSVVTIPQLHPPGAEVDWLSVWLDADRAVDVRAAALAPGRAVHVCFPGEGQEAFEGHTLALDRLGGVPRRIR